MAWLRGAGTAVGGGLLAREGAVYIKVRVFILLQSLLDRRRYSRSRADELVRLRVRFAAQPSRRQASDEQRAAADGLRRLRKALSTALSEVAACHSCAKGHPLPAGRYVGGHCCSGDTMNVFTREQVAALKVGGTQASKLRAARDDDAGCAFRGATGCVLQVEDRPSLCVAYMCQTLRKELYERDDWANIG